MEAFGCVNGFESILRAWIIERERERECVKNLVWQGDGKKSRYRGCFVAFDSGKSMNKSFKNFIIVLSISVLYIWCLIQIGYFVNERE